MARLEIGKHLVVDSRVCAGRVIFKGTRILVSDVLQLAEAGYDPKSIGRQYRGMITPEAIREALMLTRRGIIREVLPRTQAAA